MIDVKEDPLTLVAMVSNDDAMTVTLAFSSELRNCFCHLTVASSRQLQLYCFIQLRNVDIPHCPSTVGNPQRFEDEEEPKER